MIKDYEHLTISQRDAISEILNGFGTDADKDMQILKVLGFDPDIHDMFETSAALEDAKFLLTPCKLTNVKTFQYGGYTFKNPRVDGITYAQYVDLCNSTDNSGFLKAILVPEGHRYGEVDVDFSNLPYPIAASIIDPFVKSWLRLNSSSLRSLASVMKVKAMFSRAYRKKVSSTVDLYGSILRKLSSTRWV